MNPKWFEKDQIHWKEKKVWKVILLFLVMILVGCASCPKEVIVLPDPYVEHEQRAMMRMQAEAQQRQAEAFSPK